MDYGLRLSKNFTHQRAPFGNQYTPSTTMKIVGSKPVYYAEQNLMPRTGPYSPKHENPNTSHLNGMHCNICHRTSICESCAMSNHRSGVLSSHDVIPPITSKQRVSRGTSPMFQYSDDYETSNSLRKNASSVLAPLRSNNANTYYEPMAVHEKTDNQPNNDGFSTPNLQMNHSPRTVYRDAPYTNHLHYSLPSRSRYVNKSYNNNQQLQLRQSITNKDYLISKYLQLNDYLPRDPVEISNSDRRLLFQLIRHDLFYMSVEKIKKLYMDVANIDKVLDGWCDIHDFTLILARNKVSLSPEITRLIAAMSVSSNHPANQINYERFLTILARAKDEIEDNIKHTLQRDGLTPSITQTGSESPTEKRDTVELLREIESHLTKWHCTHGDIERLRLEFQRRDRHHRATLAINQITDICRRADFVLPQTIIDRILERCDRTEAGQYNWQQFMSFLERIQPLTTGLFIPVSKQPLEYAKKYRNPSENWPMTRLNKPDMDQQDTRRWEHGTPASSSSLLEPRQSDGQNNADLKPWFERFLKMANALYGLDTNNTGQVPYDQLKETVSLYNTAYTLDISDILLERAITHNYRKGFVDIHPFLINLSTGKQL